MLRAHPEGPAASIKRIRERGQLFIASSAQGDGRVSSSDHTARRCRSLRTDLYQDCLLTLRLVLGGRMAYGSHADARGCFAGRGAVEVLAPPSAGA